MRIRLKIVREIGRPDLRATIALTLAPYAWLAPPLQGLRINRMCFSFCTPISSKSYVFFCTALSVRLTLAQIHELQGRLRPSTWAIFVTLFLGPHLVMFHSIQKKLNITSLSLPLSCVLFTCCLSAMWATNHASMISFRFPPTYTCHQSIFYISLYLSPISCATSLWVTINLIIIVSCS